MKPHFVSVKFELLPYLVRRARESARGEVRAQTYRRRLRGKGLEAFAREKSAREGAQIWWKACVILQRAQKSRRRRRQEEERLCEQATCA
eukprot:2241348-Pleurochrysis_carterae.AAC.1